FPRFLRSPGVREILLRLSSSRIPTHPLDASDVKAIEEALEVMFEFTRLYQADEARGDAHMPLILQAFPGAWQWLVFLLPTSNNIRYTDNPNCDVPSDPKAYFNDDGTVEVSLHANFSALIGFVLCTLIKEEGRAACLAQSNFFGTVLDLNFPPIHTLPFGVALSSHRLSEELNDMRLDQRYSGLINSSLVAHEEENPGYLSRAMVERLAWLIDKPHLVQKYIPVYLDLIYSLLSTDRAIANFRRARGVTVVVNVLGKAVTSPGVLEDQYRDALNKFFMTRLPSLLLSTNTNEPLIAALDAGLLYIFGILATGLPDGGGAAEDYRELGNTLIRTILSPALLWPDVLRTIRRVIKRDHVFCDADVLKSRWHELGLLYLRYHMSCAVWATFRAQNKKLRYCHNAQCPSQGPHALRVCSCGEVFYCSKACQKAHWAAEHRAKCSRGMKDALQLSASSTTTSVNLGPDTIELESDTVPMTYVERAYIKSCTFETEVVDGLRFVPDIPNPAEGKAFLLDWNCGQVGGIIRDIDDWLPQPASEDGPPMVRVYARISKGHAQTIVLLDVVHRRPSDYCLPNAARGKNVRRIVE
ncbi:hypothetical protein BD626DRAFT_403515, partial [Schizophyllum amplum]